ncbi:MAG: TIGR04552 family protein [Myxococcota bacterium]|nr:TIGR04552 family protein [Myxococcota bacterium]
MLSYGLQDIEQVRLVLNGDSVVDWRKLALGDMTHIDQLLARQGLLMSDPLDVQRLNYIHYKALGYLQTFLDRPLAAEVSNPRDVRDLFLMASRGGGAVQSDACVTLKVMHIIHHNSGRELLYRLPVPINELFHRIETSVFGAIDGMKSLGISVVEFGASRKAEHSVITKLLCRKDSQAGQVHDRLRFRIVTEDVDDVLDTLVYMTKALIPFNYVVPGESRNDLIDLYATVKGDSELSALSSMLQDLPTDAEAVGDRVNHFSDRAYRDINFVVDMAVRIDDVVQSVPGFQADLDGQVVFLLVEFQVVDRATHRRNGRGHSRHSLYKARQQEKAFKRLFCDSSLT